MLSAPRAGRYVIAAVQAALRGGFLRLWDTDMTSVMSQLIEQIRRARGLSACVLLAACVSLCGCRTSAIPSPPPGPPEAPASGTPVTQVRYAKGFIVEAADGFTDTLSDAGRLIGVHRWAKDVDGFVFARPADALFCIL